MKRLYEITLKCGHHRMTFQRNPKGMFACVECHVDVEVV